MANPLFPAIGTEPPALPTEQPSVPAWHNDPATDAQRRFITALRRDRDDTGMGPTPEGNDLTKALASKAIEWLKKRPAKPAQMAVEPPVAPAPMVLLEDGFYEARDGQIYRVVTTDDTGRRYVMSLAMTSLHADTRMTWTVRKNDPEVPTLAQLSVREDIAPIDLETVRNLGAITTHCVYCNRTLTDTEPGRSTERGYGPVCAAKYGLPWG